MAAQVSKKYRFFYHYFRQKKCMSIHFKGVCTPVEHVICKASCETQWRKTQPYLVMRGFASSVEIKGNTAYII